MLRSIASAGLVAAALFCCLGSSASAQTIVLDNFTTPGAVSLAGEGTATAPGATLDDALRTTSVHLVIAPGETVVMPVTQFLAAGGAAMFVGTATASPNELTLAYTELSIPTVPLDTARFEIEIGSVSSQESVVSSVTYVIEAIDADGVFASFTGSFDAAEMGGSTPDQTLVAEVDEFDFETGSSEADFAGLTELRFIFNPIPDPVDSEPSVAGLLFSIDEITLEDFVPVPEPSSLVLSAAGLIGVVSVARYRAVRAKRATED